MAPGIHASNLIPGHNMGCARCNLNAAVWAHPSFVWFGGASRIILNDVVNAPFCHGSPEIGTHQVEPEFGIELL